MAKYKKRADGRYYALVNTGKYDDNTGKAERIPVYGTSSRDLERKVSEIKTDLSRGTYANDRNITFGDYAQKWYDSYKDGHVEEGTAQKYRGILKNHMGGIKYKRLHDISKTDVQDLFKGKSIDTQHMIKITVNQVLECAIDDGMLYHNVARNVHPKIKKTMIQSRRPLTEKEKQSILWCKENSFTEKERFFIDTLFVAGLRTEEILALTKNDIDLKKSSIRVDKALTYKGGKCLKATKNGIIRTIEVPKWYIIEAGEYMKSCKSLYVFSGYNGELISQSVYKRFWQGLYSKIDGHLGGTPDIYNKNKKISGGIHATDITPYIFRRNSSDSPVRFYA